MSQNVNESDTVKLHATSLINMLTALKGSRFYSYLIGFCGIMSPLYKKLGQVLVKALNFEFCNV